MSSQEINTSQTLECIDEPNVIEELLQATQGPGRTSGDDEEEAIVLDGSGEDEPDAGSPVAVGHKRKPGQESPIDGLVVQKKKRLCNARKLCITIAKCGEPLETVKDAFVEKIKVNFEYKFVHETHEDGDLHVHGAIKAKECIQLYDNAIVINGNRYAVSYGDMSRTPWDMLTNYLMRHQH